MRPGTRDLSRELANDLPRLPLHILADNLRSAFNVGGVLRTADAAGAEMVHLAGYTARPPHQRLLRSAQGAEKLMAWKGWPDARHTVSWLKERGFHLLGLEPCPEATDYRQYDYSWPLCLVLGNEAQGISPVVAPHLDGLVRIPMHGGKSSLNVVVAMGIVLYHIASHSERPLMKPSAGFERTTDELFESIIERSISISHVVNLWRLKESGITSSPRLVLLIHAPSYPQFKVWSNPRFGGVVLIFEPFFPGQDLAPGEMTKWMRLNSNRGETRGAGPGALLPCLSARRMAYEAGMRLAQAASVSPRLFRLTLDSFIHDLLKWPGLAQFAESSYLTRYMAAENREEMLVLAGILADRLLRPVGGTWRDKELLYEPENVTRNDRVERLVRGILGWD